MPPNEKAIRDIIFCIPDDEDHSTSSTPNVDHDSINTVADKLKTSQATCTFSLPSIPLTLQTCEENLDSHHDTLGETKNRKVKFSTIMIRLYDCTLGDNPSCSHGPPISLSWDYSEQTPMSLDDYESYRENVRKRRTRDELFMTSITRQNTLHYMVGCTFLEMENVIRDIQVIQKQRERSKKSKADKVVKNVSGTAKSSRKKKRLSSVCSHIKDLSTLFRFDIAFVPTGVLNY